MARRSAFAAVVVLACCAALAPAPARAEAAVSTAPSAAAPAAAPAPPAGSAPVCATGEASRQAVSDRMQEVRSRLATLPPDPDTVVLNPHGYNYGGAQPSDPALILFEARQASTPR